MANICAPPTRLDVVVKTLEKSQKVAMECGDKYAIVTYDLAIAKPAMQIQAQEAPLYDNVFVCFGQFHIMMASFAPLGYILDGSGGPEILCEPGLFAPGSVNGSATFPAQTPSTILNAGSNNPLTMYLNQVSQQAHQQQQQNLDPYSVAQLQQQQ